MNKNCVTEEEEEGIFTSKLYTYVVAWCKLVFSFNADPTDTLLLLGEAAEAAGALLEVKILRSPYAIIEKLFDEADLVRPQFN